MKRMTPEARAALSAKMKVVMNDPEVRRRVSDATKKAMREHAERTPDLRLLLDAWTRARPWARAQFLRLIILEPACRAQSDGPKDG